LLKQLLVAGYWLLVKEGRRCPFAFHQQPVTSNQQLLSLIRHHRIQLLPPTLASAVFSRHAMKQRRRLVRPHGLGQGGHRIPEPARRSRDIPTKRAITGRRVLDNVPPVFQASTRPGARRLSPGAAMARRNVAAESRVGGWQILNHCRPERNHREIGTHRKLA
jgi:hypothetical protein